MHGIIFSEMKKFVVEIYGAGAWDKIMHETGIGTKGYLATVTYPDKEAAAIVSAASTISGEPIAALLEKFGEFIVPDLIRIYGALLRKEWKTLDLIQYAEEVIHTAVRMRNPEMDPPKLTCTRVRDNEVMIEYASARRMCGVARGIAKGVARHYAERITIAETSCMWKGNRSCVLTIKTQ